MRCNASGYSTNTGHAFDRHRFLYCIQPPLRRIYIIASLSRPTFYIMPRALDAKQRTYTISRVATSQRPASPHQHTMTYPTLQAQFINAVQQNHARANNLPCTSSQSLPLGKFEPSRSREARPQHPQIGASQSIPLMLNASVGKPRENTEASVPPRPTKDGSSVPRKQPWIRKEVIVG